MDNLAQALEQAAASSGNRISIGPNPTFGNRSVPLMLPALIEQAAAQSLSFSSVDVTKSGSAELVAAGGAKPAAATVTVTPRTIQKIAASAVINTEAYWESTEVIATIIATLFSSCLTTEDKVANDALAAAAAAPVPAADWISAISAGQAAVAAAGGAPNLVVIPSANWPALASEVAGSTGLFTPSSDAILSVLGSRIVLSPEGAGAFVLDPAAAVHAVRDSGFIVDSASGASTNQVTIVTDLVASTFVQVPQQIAAIAVTVGP